MRNDITWLGSRTILYKGKVRVLESDSDWAVVDAINKADREEKEELARMIRELKREGKI